MNRKQKAEDFKERYKGKVKGAMQKRKDRRARGEDVKPEGKGGSTDEKNMTKREKFLEMIKSKRKTKK